MVPKGLDIHHVLHDIAAAEVACEEGREHVGVAISRLGLAAFPEVFVNGRAHPAEVKLSENRKKPAERVDCFGF